MHIHEIENMSLADLTAKRPELLEGLKALAGEELAERYLQARTDATNRDALLFDQGKTITVLQEGVEAIKEREAATVKASGEVVATLTEEAVQFREATDATIVDLNQALEAHLSIIKDLQSKNAAQAEQIADLDGRCNRLKAQAGKHAGAITAIQKISTDAISSREIDEAEYPFKGE